MLMCKTNNAVMAALSAESPKTTLIQLGRVIFVTQIITVTFQRSTNSIDTDINNVVE